MTAKVIPMPKKPTSPAKINPPEGWKDGEGFGLLWGHDAQGQPVDLVRLSDLVRWIQARDRMTFSDAVKAITEPLPDDVMGWLYGTNEDAARLIDPLHLFGFLGIEQLAKKRYMTVSDLRVELSHRNREYDARELAFCNRPNSAYSAPAKYLNQASLEYIWPQEPGRPALLRYLEAMRTVRPAILDSKSDLLPWLAIPREKAHALWGWGAVDSEGEAGETGTSELPATWKELVAYHKKNPGHSWTYDMQRIATKEEVRRNSLGFTGVRKAMASELGMSDKGLGEHIRKGAADGNKSGRGRKRAG